MRPAKVSHILTYHRLGVGQSPNPDDYAFPVLQIAAQAEVIKELMRLASVGDLLKPARVTGVRPLARIFLVSAHHDRARRSPATTPSRPSYFMACNPPKRRRAEQNDAALRAGFMIGPKVALDPSSEAADARSCRRLQPPRVRRPRCAAVATW
ncbi:hypothetical protein PG999_012123 [Apiospora kogelbergensis]|uniref:Uncharacterized protein n=1 Tax=Apiospora kogelbergensis TaxID=1337665 RepID=A0AAW0QRD4_9PEZI